VDKDKVLRVLVLAGAWTASGAAAGLTRALRRVGVLVLSSTAGVSTGLAAALVLALALVTDLMADLATTGAASALT
jgi:hypothetical protein